MGLMEAVFKRQLTKTEKEEKAREEAERKASKNTEEVVAAIGDIRVEREMLREWENVTDDGTGIVSFLASLANLTRGLDNVLTPDAQQQLAWKMAMLKYAYDDKNESAVKYYRAEITYFLALIGPLHPDKGKPAVYFMPYIQKPGQSIDEQKLMR